MSTTVAVFEQRVRRLLNDTRWSDPVVLQDRLRELATAAMHHFGERVGYATDDLSSVAVTAGVSSYTLAIGSQYSTVHWLQLNSTKDFLVKRTRAQLEAIWRDSTTPGTPTDYSLQESSTQQVEIRLRPVPDANDTLLVFGSLVPSRLTADSSTLPFSEPMLSALVKSVAADCIEGATDGQLSRLHLNRAVARRFRADAEAALMDEEVRRNRLKRTGRIEQVDA